MFYLSAKLLAFESLQMISHIFWIYILYEQPSDFKDRKIKILFFFKVRLKSFPKNLRFQCFDVLQ